jgi:hypothetical protein
VSQERGEGERKAGKGEDAREEGRGETRRSSEAVPPAERAWQAAGLTMTNLGAGTGEPSRRGRRLAGREEALNRNGSGRHALRREGVNRQSRNRGRGPA